VIHNGKIVTPQSLLPRKTAGVNYSTKKMTSNKAADTDDVDDDSVALQNDIPETNKDRSLNKPSANSGPSKKYDTFFGNFRA
jgi:hypothetical protein